MTGPVQQTLFENPPAWVDAWKGMPEFTHEALKPDRSIIVHFRNREDRISFSNLVGQKTSDKTQHIWYPEASIGRYFNKEYRSRSPQPPLYPIYVISKGRWDNRPTVSSLTTMGVPFRLVVEPQEYEDYATFVATENILQLPFSDLKQGSIPARNWVWEHSVRNGDERHWILDDNINGFYRFQNNLKVPVSCPTIFRALEQFVDRYENVAIAGMNYFKFVVRKDGARPPFVLNTRVYSCTLIQNSIPHRWRGRYNEDTDLSIRALKDGWCTMLFNAFLADKQTTMTMSGGNTDELYAADDARLKMAESLVEQHPDVARVTWKFGRWQHQVDYSGFKKNKLVMKSDVAIPDEDPYGLELGMVLFRR